ncbi:helix-turn-helix domain-containing protein [Dyadobacter sp. CY261]|uniref:helix-turn-helix domain-containing protein n=1 Tax=Dyadobacter sp. CY261 TaxID=2907203 RepID=UPI001F3479B4|nr:helix-turn-helix domain-containing protein [Dyadobacter sp. CY261]MCF0072916.1 helix-turn-helix domain-containing protein [Dyadobacter sp. CY261]
MQKKFNLKSFNLYEFLKHQNAGSFHVPFFLADKQTYQSAHVNFPFRTFTYGLGMTYSGDGDIFRIGSTDYELATGSLTTVGPGMVCQWTGNYSAEHDTVYFTEELFQGMKTNSFLQAMPYFFHGGKHVIRLTADETSRMASLFKLLKELKDEPSAVPGIVYSILMLTDSFHAKQAGQLQNNTISNREKITHAFRKLVAEQFPEHKEVAHYACALNITPKYLSEVLQAELGKTAKTFIDEYVIMEAKSLLKQTSFSIQEICYWLGYEDASHFNKSFKKFTNTTPTEYRRG